MLKTLDPDEYYFWGTHGGAELDLLLVQGGRRFGVECKRVDAPRLTPSMRIALEDLELDQINNREIEQKRVGTVVLGKGW